MNVTWLSSTTGSTSTPVVSYNVKQIHYEVFHFTKLISLKTFVSVLSIHSIIILYPSDTDTTMFVPFNGKMITTTMLTGSVIPLQNTTSTTNISWKSEIVGVRAWTVNGYSGTTSISSLQKMLVEAGLSFSTIQWIGAQSVFHESHMSSCKLYFDCDDLYGGLWVICTVCINWFLLPVRLCIVQ